MDDYPISGQDLHNVLPYCSMFHVVVAGSKTLIRARSVKVGDAASCALAPIA
jgi:hypothetical protein